MNRAALLGHYKMSGMRDLHIATIYQMASAFTMRQDQDILSRDRSEPGSKLVTMATLGGSVSCSELLGVRTV